MSTQPNSVEGRDSAYVLHPYSDARQNQRSGPLVIEGGDGVHVVDHSGNRYIEAMSGLWSVGVGFSEPRLVEAARRQMEDLPFYHGFSLKSHAPQVDLAEKLVAMAPVPMSKVFFTNSGSEANDTAVKLIWYRSNALGRPERKKIIARRGGYHGVTIVGASLTGIERNHLSFDLPIANIIHTDCPHYWKEGRPGETEDEFSDRLARSLEQLILDEGPETVAAFFAEPVMGAGGVIVPPEGYWQKIQAVLKRYDILLVADEVICGFGRTGRMFGSETYDIEPDIVILSKQLSSSYLPISAVMVSERVFEPIADESHRIGALAHGFTAGGHPVCAAVALENLAIIEERDLVANARDTGAHMLRRLNGLADHPMVGEVRGVGMIAAVELVAEPGVGGEHKPGTLGGLVNGYMQQNGVITRNMTDALAFCPPLITTPAQIDEIVTAFEASLDAARCQPVA